MLPAPPDTAYVCNDVMIGCFARRLLLAMLTIWVISLLTFFIIRLPPGAYFDRHVSALESQGTVLTEQQIEALRRRYGLDQPFYVHYIRWVRLLAQANFGVSPGEFGSTRLVREIVAERLGLTVVVTLAATLFTWVVALPIGIYSAVRQYSIGDTVFTVMAYVGVATPDFLLALAVMYFAAVGFNADVGGLFSHAYLDAPWNLAKAWDMIKHLPLPTLIVGLGGTAGLIRIMRANLLDELRKPYVVTARAKGLAETRVIFKYPVRVALNPFASTIGYLLPNIVSGSTIVALVMSLPTVAPVLYQALLTQDMILAGNIVVLLSVLTVLGTFLSDLLLLWIDPRIRVEAR